MKGEYESYDTFIRAEPLHYLRQYLEARRTGRLDSRIKPEIITETSPLVRDALWDKTRRHNPLSDQPEQPNPIGPKQVFKIVNELYVKTGLVKPGESHYTLRAHSLGKFFKTNMVTAGVAESHVDYMMGRVIDTYNQVQSLGVDKLREIYAKGQLTIRPQSQQNLTRTRISLIEAAGRDPQKYLSREALSEPHRTTSRPETLDQREARILLLQLTEYFREQLSQRS